MRFSRRSFLGAAAGAAAAAAAALASGEASTTGVAAAMRARVSGDVVGKITVGQQGWFACARDGAPIGCWWHWSPDWSKPPSPPANGNLKAWPSMSGYARGYPTAYASLGDGRPATLFSSFDQSTINAHFRSMQLNGCHTAALQRFNPFGGEGPTRDAIAGKVRKAAEAHGRKFYIMYDVSGWTGMQASAGTGSSLASSLRRSRCTASPPSTSSAVLVPSPRFAP